MTERIERLNYHHTLATTFVENAWTFLCDAERELLAALAGDDDAATFRAMHAWKSARAAHACAEAERDLFAHMLRAACHKYHVAAGGGNGAH